MLNMHPLVWVEHKAFIFYAFLGLKKCPPLTDAKTKSFKKNVYFQPKYKKFVHGFNCRPIFKSYFGGSKGNDFLIIGVTHPLDCLGPIIGKKISQGRPRDK